jgi:hypothetical protein
MSLTTFHNLLSLLYCTILCTYLFFFKDIYDSIYLLSMLYFIPSTIINIYEKSYVYIIHHIICIFMLTYPYTISIHEAKKEKDTKDIICIMLMAEVSTFFLSLKYFLPRNSWLRTVNDLLFSLSFISIRMVYILYYVIIYIYKTRFFLILPLACIMYAMNIYWTYAILHKIYKKFF